MRKVNIQVLRQWVTEKITEILRFEDDVVVEYAYGLLENNDDPVRILAYATGHMLVYQSETRCPTRARCKST